MHHRLFFCFFLCCALVNTTASSAQTPESDQTVATKKGWDFVGLPLLNFTSDRGFGYGAFVAAIDHGPARKPGDPYHASIGGQFYQTTGGYAFHKLILDLPRLNDSGLRLNLIGGYEAWDSAWYFGQGNKRPRLRPEDTPEDYYTSEINSFWLVPQLRIPIGRPLWLFTGLILRSAQVNAYPDSLLQLEQPEGMNGGLLFMGSLGIMIDTRDQEPTPTRGLFTEVSFRGGHPELGSDFGMWGINFTHRQWFPLVGEKLVFALRIAGDSHHGEVPFFHQHILGGSEWVYLGGNFVLRGLPQGRYRGQSSFYANKELRWRFSEFERWGRRFELMAVPFVDSARVWVDGENDALTHLHVSGGLGMRVIYERSLVMRLEGGCGVEEYTNDKDSVLVTERRPVIGIYLLVGHPF